MEGRLRRVGAVVWRSGDELDGGRGWSPSFAATAVRPQNAPLWSGRGGLDLGGAVESRVRKSGAVSRRHGDGRSGGREVGPSFGNGGGGGENRGSEGLCEGRVGE